MMILPLALLAAPVQETSILGFVDQATYKPPHTLADAGELLLNHAMTETSPGVFRVSVRTTDSAVTDAEFRESAAGRGAMLILRFSGKCYPRKEVLARGFQQLVRGEPATPGALAYWGTRTEWGTYALGFERGGQHCLRAFTLTLDKP